VTTDDLRALAIRALQRIAPEVDATTLRGDHPLREQVDLDSVDWLNFLVALHEATGVDIPEADAAQLVTLDALVAYLAARAGSGGP
jgi:acyl carrier protein